jgi:hypothetical protein
MGDIERYEGWKPRAKSLYDEAIADRDRWRREYEAEKAKVRRVEHDLRGAVDAERARIVAWLRTEPSSYIGPNFCGQIADLLDAEGGSS